MNDDDVTPDNKPADKSDPRVIDLSKARKDKAKKTSNAGDAFKPKSWNITYKKDSWGSGNGDGVAPKSHGNAGYRGGGGSKGPSEPFFNFDNIPAFTRFTLMAFAIVHVLVTLVLSADYTSYVMSVFAFIPGVFTGDYASPSILLSYLSPVTYMYLHGDWLHLIFNMIMMVAFGTMIERDYGAKLAAILFFIGGLAGALVFFVLSSGEFVQLIGASAGLSALFGAAILRMARQMRRLGAVGGLSPRTMIIVWVVIMVVTGMMGGNVAWTAHLAGFFTGLALYEMAVRGILRY